MITGAASVEINPSGPVQLNESPPAATVFKLMSEPSQ
jgi:hypothetical protein